jgi:hypothetical protein
MNHRSIARFAIAIAPSSLAFGAAAVFAACSDGAPNDLAPRFALDPNLHVASSPVSLASVPPSELARAQQYLDSLYTHADVVHSFQTIIGEEIELHERRRSAVGESDAGCRN